MTTFVLNTPPGNLPGDRRTWGGLHQAAASLAIVEAARAASQMCLVITESAKAASRLEGELSFFANGENLPVLHFPDWETLPYDVFSPHQDIISERLFSLFQ